MKVAVVGTRTMTDRDYLVMILENHLALWGPFTVISGGAQGADTLAVQWAESEGLPTEIYPADWKTHGRAAGPRRNQQIVAAADAVIAFWDGISRGTGSTVRLAQEQQKPLWVYDDQLPVTFRRMGAPR